MMYLVASKKLIIIFVLSSLASHAVTAQHLYTKGLIMFNSSSDASHMIKIYAKSGVLFKQFEFVDASDENPVINPYMYSSEYGFLMFNYLGDEGKYYKVVIDEKKRQIGYIPKNDKRYYFESWERHVVHSIAAVSFNASKNPARKQPVATASLSNVTNVAVFSPQQVAGNWLKVGWEEPKKGTGWIKWKDEHNDLLIELFYMM